MKKTLIATVLGAVVLFVWGAISWTVLPWHHSTIHTFEDESGVAEYISAQTSESGIYYLPGKTMGDFPEEDLATSKALYETGPVLFVSAHLGPSGSMGLGMAKSFAVQFLSALAVVLLLQCGHVERFACRWRACILIGLAIGIQANLPNMIWWSFPADYVFIGVADTVIAWTLAGFVISKSL